MAKVTKEQKIQIVTTLKERLSKAVGLVLTDYHGLSVSQMQELKKILKPLGAEFTVVKNTLLTLASKGTGKKVPEEVLTGPTAILFSFEDAIEPIKKLADFIKQYKLPKIKLGFLESKLLSAEDVANLAKIPSRPELHANLVGTLNSPIYGLVGVLNANLRNLVFALDQIRAKKGD